MTSTPANPNPSGTTRVQRGLKEHAGFRFILVGIVLLVTAVTQLMNTLDTTTGFSANRVVQLFFAAAGTALVVAGIVKARRR